MQGCILQWFGDEHILSAVGCDPGITCTTVGHVTSRFPRFGETYVMLGRFHCGGSLKVNST